MAVGQATLTLVAVTVVAILVGIYLRNYENNDAQLRLQLILEGLLETEKEIKVPPSTKIGIGFGSCQDLIIPGREIFKNLKAPDNPKNHDIINTEEEFLEVFTYYFQHGAAAERFVANEELFQKILKKARASPEARYHIGGNAPLMAARFAKEGAQVLLGSHMSLALREKMPEGVTVSGPEVEEDDFHLLLEYSTGDQFIQYKAPRANRFIVHNDHTNPRLTSIVGFGEKLTNFNPSLFVLGGVQMMDNFPYRPGQLDKAINRLMDVLEDVPEKTAIHFEMASYVDHNLMKIIIKNVLPMADSLGMNEQELPNLISLLKYDNISYVSDSYPKVSSVLDQTRELFTLLYSSKPQKRALSRIHIHTLAFQAILRVVHDPKNNVVQWKNTAASAAKAALTAHRHTCGSHDIDINRAKIIMDDSFTTTQSGPNRQRIPFNAEKPVRCWEETLEGINVKVEICVAPVLVCTKVLQTGGGGDNVSAAGLVLQV